MVARETSIRDGLRVLGLQESFAATLDRYCVLLEEIAIPHGYLGPAEAKMLVERHILDGAALMAHLGPHPLEASVVDVGSGAGLPGLVLAILRPAARTALIESEGRRASFLDRASAELELDVEIVRARAEDAARLPAHREAFDVAVARALAAPPVTLELTLPFVRAGGRALIAVGPSIDLEACARAAVLLAGGPPQLRPVEVPGLASARSAMIVPKIGVGPDRYPRRTGIPAKRPLA